MITKIFRFYIEGFRAMTLGRILWAIILVKLFIMFFVLKLFFFPDIVKRQGSEADRIDFVADEMLERVND